ncbi:MAG: hypothetical protein A2Y88_06395 [Chloroflexi bacterium RBG_13_48_10]|nr:MAG: hypothetical protein A2Y88_06395 [Chloroflexi bacterium RBG_13_48_10]
MKPVQIDVYYPVPDGWGICNSCEVMMAQANLGQAPHERGLDEYPPEWQEEFKRLASTIFNLADHYQDKVQIRIWDPRSLQGLWRSIRHGVRRYPTFVVNGHNKITGWDTIKLDQYIQAAVEIDIFAL